VAEAHAIESNRVENSSASATARLYLLLYLRHLVCVQTRLRCLRRGSRSGQTMINDDTSCGGCGAEKIRCTDIEGLKGSLRLQLTEDGCARLNALHVIAGSLILFGVISLQHRANVDPLPQLQWTGHERLACASSSSLQTCLYQDLEHKSSRSWKLAYFWFQTLEPYLPRVVELWFSACGIPNLSISAANVASCQTEFGFISL
jgi:hypothetical protein